MKNAPFDFSRLSAFKPFLEREQLLFALFVPASLVPFFLFDRVDLPYIGILLFAVLALSKALLPRFWKQLWILPALTAFSLASGEIYIRVSSFGWQGLNLHRYLPADPAHPLSGLSVDGNSLTNFKPGGDYFLWGHSFHANSDGFRGRSYPVAKPPGTFRIVVLGASFTLGVGVDQEERFTDLLERMLNEHSPGGRKYEVINFSLVGNTLGNLAFYLRAAGLKYSPDLILFEIGAQSLSTFSDLTIQPNPGRFKEPEEKSRLFPGNPYLDASYGFFFNQFFLARVIYQFKRSGEGPGLVPFSTVARGLQQIREVAGKIPLVVFHLRSLSSDMNDVNYQLVYRRMTRRAASELGIRVIDTTYAEYPRLPPSRLMVYPGDLHPNGIMHRIYAETLFKRLGPFLEGGGVGR